MNLSRPNWTNMRITSQHWHYAALVVLILLNATLAVRLAIAWDRTQAGNAVRVQEQRSQYEAMQLKTRPLRGLDNKIVQAKTDQQAFYDKRFPENYSAWLTELGKLAVENNVLLLHGQYTQSKPNQGLSEIRMEESLSGDYAPVVRFINGLERDKMLFLIEGIALSGQENGVVSLRMRLTTYLHADTAQSNGAAAASVLSDNNSSTQQ
jgi:Tfp pilus assembly protein PilO